MVTVPHTRRFQIVLPKSIRDLLRLRPGQKLEAIASVDLVELIPVRRMREMRGFLRGIETTVEREPNGRRTPSTPPTDSSPSVT
jgi:AbrB family looped-hinge helix DNA binding protein